MAWGAVMSTGVLPLRTAYQAVSVGAAVALLSLDRCFNRYRVLYLRRLDEGAFCLCHPHVSEHADRQRYADAT